MRTIPEQLIEISDWLARRKVKLVGGNENQRINSVKSHTLILDMLRMHQPFGVKPFARPGVGWYSFEIEGDNSRTLSVKIKVSTFLRADNLNCKLGMFYALTGERPQFTDEIKWEHYFDLLSKNLDRDCEDDFYFLVVNATDSSDVFCNSLKGIGTLSPNGSNVPFQCKWSDNREPCNRSNVNATDYILTTLEKSALLRADMYHRYKKFFS